MRTIIAFILIALSVNTKAQVDLNRIGQTPGGSGYHVNYDSLSHRLFVGAGTSIWVYDVSDINNPVIIGKRPFLGLITETILYDNNTLFVSATFDGVYAIDLSSEDLPVIDHKYLYGIDSRAAYDMLLVGDTLFIPTNVCVTLLKYTDGVGFTNLYDIGPYALFLQGNAFCVAEKGNYFAIGVKKLLQGEIRIYNKNDLSNPITSWQDSTIIAISKLKFSDTNDSIIYACGSSSNLGITSHFISLNFDGSNLTKLDSYDINGIPIIAAANIQNMDIQNDTLYLATGCAEDTSKGAPLSYIPIFDATGLPADTLKEIGYINAGLWHFDVSLIKGTPYMATASEWLGVAINNVKSGIPFDTLMLLPTGGWTQKGKVRGDTLWVAHEGWGLAAYNIDSLMFSNGYMTNSKILHIFNINTDTASHEFVGDFEFINDTLLILSSGTVYNLKPWLQGGQPDSVYHIHFLGEVHNAYSNTGQKRIVVGSLLFSISLFDPFSANSNALATINTLNNSKSIFIKDDIVFYGSKNDTSSSITVYLVASEIQDSSFLTIDSINAGTGQINSIAIENNMVAVGKGNSIRFYNWDGSHFTYIDSIFDINMTEVNIELKNNYLYIADKKKGVIIIDVSDNTYPIVGKFEGRGTWTNLFGSEDIEIADDGKIYLSDFNAGVIIIEAFDTTLASSVKTITETNNNVKIYPNPATDIINIEINQENKLNYTISIFNVKGQKIFEHNYKKNNILLDLKFKKGVYIVEVSNENFTENKKIIIK